MINYPRFSASNIKDALTDTPVVSILGPRQVGKSTLAKALCPQLQYITLDDTNLLKLAIQDSVGFIDSLPEYVVIDEIQRAPQLVLAIKKSVDENRKPGRFLLTGSANLMLMKQIQDSLAGRHEPFHLMPISSHEKHQTQAHNSFVSRLLGGEIKPKVNAYKNSMSKLQNEICDGGFPVPLTRSFTRARKWFSVYIDDVINKDVSYIETIRNPAALHKLMKICAARTASLLVMNTVSNELKITVQTSNEYMAILEKLFLVYQLPAWSSNKAKRLIKSPKMHIIDSGMACAMNNLGKDDWLEQATLFGHIIESYVVQQVKTQLAWQPNDVECYHFRDDKKREVDLVLEQGNNVWGIEVKRASTINDADLKGMDALAQLTGNNWSGGIIFYNGEHILPTRVDKVLAVPFTALWEGVE